MLKIEKTLFISYRRTNIGFALAIHQNLISRGYDAFFDYENVGAGDFEQILLRSIESRAHFVVILTPSALKRCKKPNDWLRREIEHALLHKRNIIPLTFDGFDFKDMPRFLPEHIALPLSKYNALRVPIDYFSEAMTKLTERMSIPLDAVLHPASMEVQHEIVRQQKVIATKPTAEDYYKRALRYYDLGRYNAAIINNSKAIRLKPDFAEAYHNRGGAKENLGDHDGALDDYTQALSHKPDFATAYYNRGVAKFNKGDYVGAIADYDDILRLEPDHAEAYGYRGWAKSKQGAYDGAITDCNQALHLLSDYTEAYYIRADAKHNKGDIQGAIEDYARFLEFGGDELWGNRAEVEKIIADLQKRL